VKLRVGSRRSPLARTQTEQACHALCARVSGLVCETVFLDTTGDKVREGALRDVGGKGLFVKELDEALLEGRIDCAVHSLKDVPSELPAGVCLAATPRRADPRDLLVSRSGWKLEDLPRDGVIGTTSLRRGAQARAVNATLRIEILRGNVGTRMGRVADGDFDATFLAAAGIARLGVDIAPLRAVFLDPQRFIPAPGQGALAFTAREHDRSTLEVLQAIEEWETRAAVEAERAVARALGGSCFLPIGAYGRVVGDRLDLVATIVSPAGDRIVSDRTDGPATDAPTLGRRLGETLRAAGGAKIVEEALRHG